MALSGESARFLYSSPNASGFATQGDPDLSIGGRRPRIVNPSDYPLSCMYAQASLDGVSPAINQLSASTPDSGETRVPAVDDWVMVVTGAAAPAFGKIVAINSGVLTLDRPLPALTAASDFIRISKINNIFPDPTPAQVSSGLIDYRSQFFFQQGGGTETNFKFWVEPLTPSAATIAIAASGDNGGGPSFPIIAAPGTDNPFNQFGHIGLQGGPWSPEWRLHEKPAIRYSEGASTPTGSDPFVANGSTPMWLNRVIPAGAAGGKCVFAVLVKSDDDPSPDPDPFITGFIFEFEIPELTYTATLEVDRTVYIGGGARVTATVVDQFAQPAAGVNARIEILSGPGTINTDLDGLTDSNGQVTAAYVAPTVVTIDPVLRVTVPTNSEL